MAVIGEPSTQPSWIDPPVLALVVPATLVASLPWFTHFAVPKLLVAALLLAWLSVQATLRWRRGVGPFTGIGPWLLLLVLLTSAPAWFFVESPWESLRQAVLGVESLVLLGLAAGAPRRAVIRYTIPYMAVALAVTEAIWAYEVFGGTGAGFAAVPGGATLGNPGLVGEVCGIGALVVAAGFFTATRPWTKGAYASLAVSLAAVTVLSGSMTGLLALLVGSVVWSVSAVRRAGRLWVALGIALALPAALGLALLVPEVALGLQRRFYLYRIAWDVLWQHPWLGGGIGSFAHSFLDAQGAFLERHPELSGWWSQVSSAHSAWLSLACERGLFAALAWGGFFAWAVVRLWKQRRAWSLGVLVAVLVCYSASISFETVPLGLWGVFWVGLTAFPRATPGAGVRWPRIWAVFLVLGAAASLGMASYVAYVDAAVARGDVDAALDAAPFHGYARYLKGSALANAGRMPQASEELQRADKDYASIAARMELGRALYRSGHTAQAESYWLSVVRWHRTFMPAYANLAVLYAETHRPDLAHRYLTRALSLRPSDPRVKAVQKRVRELTGTKK